MKNVFDMDYDIERILSVLKETIPRIQMVWNSIPMQLSKGNQKFIYGMTWEGTRCNLDAITLLVGDNIFTDVSRIGWRMCRFIYCVCTCNSLNA
ncbi:MAG: hypothetical protein K2H31_03390 [Lachnospiraceae bacterium]|nr:hypothetical protein [Lachnospiraceae bacterium]